MIQYTIGRDKDNDIVLEPENVSAKHAVLKYYDGNRAVIEDLDSANGVWVNYRKVKSCLVTPDDEIQIATYNFYLRDHFRFEEPGQVIIGVKDVDDYRDYFPSLVKIEEDHEAALDKINKDSGKYMMAFRIVLGFMTLISLSAATLSRRYPSLLDLTYLVPILLILSIYLYSIAMKKNRDKEKLKRKVREDHRLNFCCPKCNGSLNYSTYMMKKKKEYRHQCNALLYKVNVIAR